MCVSVRERMREGEREKSSRMKFELLNFFLFFFEITRFLFLTRDASEEFESWEKHILSFVTKLASGAATTTAEVKGSNPDPVGASSDPRVSKPDDFLSGGRGVHVSLDPFSLRTSYPWCPELA